MAHYGIIIAPLTQLLKKDTFLWDEQATEAFETLKKAMVTLPMLSLLDLSKLFMIETHAYGSGLGVILTHCILQPFVVPTKPS